MCPAPFLLANIRRIIKLHDRMRKPVCERFGLTQIEASIVSFLHNNPGKDTAADIVELRRLSKSNVSQAVESLIRKSLLVRRQDAADRRRIHLSLTPAAKPITREVEQMWKCFHWQIFRGFTEEEERQFAAFHERIAENAAAEGGEAQ